MKLLRHHNGELNYHFLVWMIANLALAIVPLAVNLFVRADNDKEVGAYLVRSPELALVALSLCATACLRLPTLYEQTKSAEHGSGRRGKGSIHMTWGIAASTLAAATAAFVVRIGPSVAESDFLTRDGKFIDILYCAAGLALIVATTWLGLYVNQSDFIVSETD